MRQLSLILPYMFLCAATVPLPGLAADDAARSATVQSRWQPAEIHYSYTAFTTAYNCDAAASKLKQILTELGAHPQTKVSATGCFSNRPSREFLVTIRTAVPVAVAHDTAPLSTQQQAQLQQFAGKSGAIDAPFAATWRTLDLSRDRKLDLQAGDCELMEGLRDHVLPRLSIKVIADDVQCMPRQLGMQAPQLQVSALVPADSDADKVATR